MRYGINVPIFGAYADVRLLAALARDAEVAGWDGFFVWDHLHWSGAMDGAPRQPVVDPWIALTAIALTTSRITFGPMVTPVARRRPWKLARETVTLDHLSGGRLILGVGLGDPAGLEFTDFGEAGAAQIRAQKLDEGLDILVGLWSGEPFSYTGTHYTLSNVQLLPTPLQQPRIPIWAACVWPNHKPLRRAARWDGVFAIGREDVMQPDDVRAMRASINHHRPRTAPFEVAHWGRASGADVARDAALVTAYAAAGMTWWMQDEPPWFGPVAAMRARIRQGPPNV
jgi:alkanesulfonate monooxygenase SsuD/methylene tetrahydromethanopterin reductase-like flavin-dependent oxidoreductase (luciferase family)